MKLRIVEDVPLERQISPLTRANRKPRNVERDAKTAQRCAFQYRPSNLLADYLRTSIGSVPPAADNGAPKPSEEIL